MSEGYLLTLKNKICRKTQVKKYIIRTAGPFTRVQFNTVFTVLKVSGWLFFTENVFGNVPPNVKHIVERYQVTLSHMFCEMVHQDPSPTSGSSILKRHLPIIPKYPQTKTLPCGNQLFKFSSQKQKFSLRCLTEPFYLYIIWITGIDRFRGSVSLVLRGPQKKLLNYFENCGNQP